MPRVLKRIESVVPRRALDYGGRARELATLARAGFPVPAAYAMPGWVADSFFATVLEVGDRPRALLRTPYVSDTRLQSIAARVREATLPGDVVRSVSDAVLAMRQEGAGAFAVRSSATHDDQERASSAGMHLTLLNLHREDEILAAIKACWASLFRPRVLSYLRSQAEDMPVSIGVVIQAMVPAEVSGVLLTSNPLTEDPCESVIHASYGLGHTVVDGRVAPDTFRVDKSTGQLRDRVIGDKTLQTVLSDVGGVIDIAVPEEKRHVPSLAAPEIAQLLALSKRIESHFGDARAVEWAISADQPFILQARPMVFPRGRLRKAGKRERPTDRRKLVWSNANVGEALPGVATPLTWSVLSRFSELGFRQAFGSLGCTVPRDAELVGDFRGRVYLNLTEFSSILSQVPWIHPSTLVKLGGGGYVQELDELARGRGSAGFFLRLPATVARYARQNFRLQARIEAFERDFGEERERLRTFDSRLLEPSGLDRMLRDVERLLDVTGSVMLTVYADLLTAVLVLIGLLGTTRSQEGASLYRDLMSGLDHVDSAQPGLVLWNVARLLRKNPELSQLIASTPVSELSVEQLPPGPVQDALFEFLREHGHRGIKEAEIASPRWSEDPTLVFAALRSFLSDQVDVRGRRGAQALARERAETELEKTLPLPMRPIARRLLHLVRHFTRMREHLRGYVVEVLGLFRLVALEASRRIEAREPEAGSDAAFFLTIEELRHVLHDENERVAIRAQRRRVEFERNQALPDPPATFVGYPPELIPQASSVRSLRGLAASRGVAEGKARVLREPSQAEAFEPGEILVVPAADTGWAPLFLGAAGVITELGGPLSHAAIILREYAVPAVVNVSNATRLLCDGVRVRVDGDTGLVEILGD
jgi:phosphohistidine swiveling domain-containing protein